MFRGDLDLPAAVVTSDGDEWFGLLVGHVGDGVRRRHKCRNWGNRVRVSGVAPHTRQRPAQMRGIYRQDLPLDQRTGTRTPLREHGGVSVEGFNDLIGRSPC